MWEPDGQNFDHFLPFCVDQHKGDESGFHFPSSIFHLRNLKNVEKAAISCVFEVDR